jgi:hypothetical protein
MPALLRVAVRLKEGETSGREKDKGLGSEFC